MLEVGTHSIIVVFRSVPQFFMFALIVHGRRRDLAMRTLSKYVTTDCIVFYCLTVTNMSAKGGKV